MRSLGRLAQNLDDLRSLVQRLIAKGMRIEFLEEHLVFTSEDSPMANLMSPRPWAPSPNSNAR